MKKRDFTNEEEGGLVYSTNPNALLGTLSIQLETLPPSKQPLRIVYERAGRGGKEVTLIKGFAGTESDLKELGKQLKQSLGCGGSTKDGLIILQGDRRQVLQTLLIEWGYTRTK